MNGSFATVTGWSPEHFVEAAPCMPTFTVTPSVGSTTVFQAIQSIPVCATDIENLWGGGKQGGGSTNAIPGCEEYQE